MVVVQVEEPQRLALQQSAVVSCGDAKGHAILEHIEKIC